MGFSERRSEKPVAAPSSAGVGALTAFIDQGSEFTGKLSFKDTVRIDGTFEGEISSDNTLIVGETGVIEASIQSQVVIVSGVVNGDIKAGRQVVLHKTARVKGAIDTASLVIEDGAELSGEVRMGKGKGDKPQAQPQSGSPSKPEMDKSGPKSSV
jgi:cytoskeletal protein CcmA (bactofilin family)